MEKQVFVGRPNRWPVTRLISQHVRCRDRKDLGRIMSKESQKPFPGGIFHLKFPKPELLRQGKYDTICKQICTTRGLE